MAGIGHKLETKGVIMTLLSLVLISTGCEDKIDSPAVNPSEGKTVEITLDLGFADETDGYTLSAPLTTKSNGAAFNYALQPAVTTKGAESSLKPTSSITWKYNNAPIRKCYIIMYSNWHIDTLFLYLPSTL